MTKIVVNRHTMHIEKSPSELAHEYAKEHCFRIEKNGRRYDIYGCDVFVTQVGGYAAALNAMKREVSDQVKVVAAVPGGQAVIERGELNKAKDAGVSAMELREVVEDHPVAIPTIKPGEFVEVTAHVVQAPPPSNKVGFVVTPPVRLERAGHPDYFEQAGEPARERIRQRAAALVIPKPWRIMQRNVVGAWVELACSFVGYHEAISECRRLQMLPALRHLERRVEYRP